MLCLERLLRDEADHAKLAERRCRMLRIRKEKLYGVALGIGKLRDDICDFLERWKLQRDRITPGAMVGDRVGGLCAVVQRNVRLLVRRIRDGPVTVPARGVFEPQRSRKHPIGKAGIPVTATEPKTQDTAERRQVTVMFSDLVGSTALSARMDAEDFREVISAYQKCVAEIVRRFGGFVAKYMGDGVLIYFGYPQAHEDDAEQAVRAGLELVAA